jgi:hypothetical protein
VKLAKGLRKHETQMTTPLGQALDMAEALYEIEFKARSQKEHKAFLERVQGKHPREIHRMGYIMGAVAVLRGMDTARDLVRDN